MTTILVLLLIALSIAFFAQKSKRTDAEGKIRAAENRLFVAHEKLAENLEFVRSLQEEIRLKEAEFLKGSELARSEMKGQADCERMRFQEEMAKQDQRLNALRRQGEELKNREAREREAVEKIANHFIGDSLRNLCALMGPNNYELSKKKFDKVVQLCRKCNVDFPDSDLVDFYSKLKESYEIEVRKQAAREEQARIKEKIREEVRDARERDEEIRRLEREQAAIQTALDRALQKTKDEHSEEVERLKAKLEEAMGRFERAKSQAELTRAGNVYVISNIGSFGDGVFKVGMTRRLEPMDRVRELGDASVPFPFDVHMMISSDDAPTLETALHKELHKRRLNKVNLRREFFKADIETIGKLVEKFHGKVEYIAKPEALEYRESLLKEQAGYDEAFDSKLDGDREAEEEVV